MKVCECYALHVDALIRNFEKIKDEHILTIFNSQLLIKEITFPIDPLFDFLDFSFKIVCVKFSFLLLYYTTEPTPIPHTHTRTHSTIPTFFETFFIHGYRLGMHKLFSFRIEFIKFSLMCDVCLCCVCAFMYRYVFNYYRNIYKHKATSCVFAEKIRFIHYSFR